MVVVDSRAEAELLRESNAVYVTKPIETQGERKYESSQVFLNTIKTLDWGDRKGSTFDHEAIKKYKGVCKIKSFFIPLRDKWIGFIKH